MFHNFQSRTGVLITQGLISVPSRGLLSPEKSQLILALVNKFIHDNEIRHYATPDPAPWSRNTITLPEHTSFQHTHSDDNNFNAEINLRYLKAIKVTDPESALSHIWQTLKPNSGMFVPISSYKLSLEKNSVFHTQTTTENSDGTLVEGSLEYHLEQNEEYYSKFSKIAHSFDQHFEEWELNFAYELCKESRYEFEQIYEAKIDQDVKLDACPKCYADTAPRYPGFPYHNPTIICGYAESSNFYHRLLLNNENLPICPNLNFSVEHSVFKDKSTSDQPLRITFIMEAERRHKTPCSFCWWV